VPNCDCIDLVNKNPPLKCKVWILRIYCHGINRPLTRSKSVDF
jgi:hypothetical protein